MDKYNITPSLINLITLSLLLSIASIAFVILHTHPDPFRGYQLNESCIQTQTYQVTYVGNTWGECPLPDGTSTICIVSVDEVVNETVCLRYEAHLTREVKQ